MLQPSSNLHTHTYRCKHADGDVDDYCRAAIDAGLQVLGMSDHTALPDDRWLDVRMAYADLGEYMECISIAQERYVDALTILRAVECEYDADYEAYYRDELLGDYACDYLIGAVHYFDHNGEWLSPFVHMANTEHMQSFTDYFIQSMDCGLFSFMAHPDSFAASCPVLGAERQACVHAMCQAAVDLNMPWEINGYGFRKRYVDGASGKRPPYPLREFWDIVAEYPIKVVINSDAHRPIDVAANLDDATAVAVQRDLEILDWQDIVHKKTSA